MCASSVAEHSGCRDFRDEACCEASERLTGGRALGALSRCLTVSIGFTCERVPVVVVTCGALPVMRCLVGDVSTF